VDLHRGFAIEEPAILVPWRCTEDALARLLPSAREVTRGYITTRGVCLTGLLCDIGFHFEPRIDGRMREVELFHSFGYDDLAASYASFQQHLEATFGPPTSTEPGDEGFLNCVWHSQGATIRHFVFDRFGPEEHVRIRR
jgi:hypothetical protein